LDVLHVEFAEFDGLRVHFYVRGHYSVLLTSVRFLYV
jgi:hypothetical protein